MKKYMQENVHTLLSFLLDQWCYALAIESIEQVISAVEVTPLPQAPSVVSGIINYHGRIIPAIDLRKRLSMPEKDISPDMVFIIAHTKKRTVALIADSVQNVFQCSADAITSPDSISSGITYVKGIISLKNGMIFICGLDEFLSLDEEQMLDGSLTEFRKSQP